MFCEPKYRPENFKFSLRVRERARWGVAALAATVGALAVSVYPPGQPPRGVGRPLPRASGSRLEEVASVRRLGPVGETQDREGK